MKITYFLILLLLIPLSLFGEQKAYQVIKNALKTHNNNREITYQMTIQDSGDKKVRMFLLKKKQNEKISNTFIRFFKPASMRGTGFLIKNENDKEHQWIYLSAFKIIRKLSNSEKNNSFMGSDFTNSDVSGVKLEEYSYKILKETDKRHIIEALPKKATNYYEKLIVTINKEKMVISGIIFYRDNKPFKILKNSNWLQKNQEWIPQKSLMRNLTKKTETNLIMLSVDTNVALSNSLFEPDALAKF